MHRWYSLFFRLFIGRLPSAQSIRPYSSPSSTAKRREDEGERCRHATNHEARVADGRCTSWMRLDDVGGEMEAQLLQGSWRMPREAALVGPQRYPTVASGRYASPTQFHSSALPSPQPLIGGGVWVVVGVICHPLPVHPSSRQSSIKAVADKRKRKKRKQRQEGKETGKRDMKHPHVMMGRRGRAGCLIPRPQVPTQPANKCIHAPCRPKQQRASDSGLLPGRRDRPKATLWAGFDSGLHRIGQT